MYAEFLQPEGWRIEEADDGREALAKAIALIPTVLVTETRLTGISGIDLCTLLRRDEATRKIPIVIVTADAFKDDVQRARISGADAVLTKPCLPERLAAELARLVADMPDRHDRAGAERNSRIEQLPRSLRALARSPQAAGQTRVKRTHGPADAVAAASPPLPLVCPSCDRPLTFERSHVGGVGPRHIEQWDYFMCTAGCGMFQYRVRTRKLRRVS